VNTVQDAQHATERAQKRNFTGFLIHALFLALTLNFIDVNTVVPNLLAEAGGTAVHLGLLSGIMVGGTKFMQLVFAGMIVPLERKRGALLVGIYIRVASLLLLGLFIRTLAGASTWKIWAIISVMTVFSFSGAYANIAYTDIMGKVIVPEKRKRLLVVKQLISSIGVILSALLVKVILGNVAYPDNYSLLYLLAGTLLLLGTIGFWMIVEPVSQAPKRQNLREKWSMFWSVLKYDGDFRKYLFLINTTGIVASLLPFLILFGRTQFPVDGNLIGTFLLVQMAGSLGTNILLNLFSTDQRYRSLIYVFVLVSLGTPLIALLVPAHPLWYALVFLFSGTSHTLNQILSSGILLEISTNENRAVYTGLSGAGSIMQVIYPLAAGALIGIVGYSVVFIVSALYMSLGLYSARTIRCSAPVSS
jgi:MFS family permease